MRAGVCIYMCARLCIFTCLIMCVCARARSSARVYACVIACVRACVRAYVRVCVSSSVDVKEWVDNSEQRLKTGCSRELTDSGLIIELMPMRHHSTESRHCSRLLLNGRCRHASVNRPPCETG